MSGPVGDKTILIARPPMPRELTGEARAEWRRIVPELERAGMLARVDRGMLLRYCAAWADWCELRELLGRSGKVIRGQKGNLVRNPLWLLLQDAERTLTELARQLGLTPASRLRAGIVHERPDDGREDRRLTIMEEYRRKLLGPEGAS